MARFRRMSPLVFLICLNGSGRLAGERAAPGAPELRPISAICCSGEKNKMKLSRHLVIVVIVVMLASGLVTAPELRGADANADAEQAIRAIMAGQVREWNEGSLEGFMSGYLQSPEMSFQSGNRRLKGWQALLDMYKKNYSGAQRGTLTFSDIEIRFLTPDYALVMGRWNVTTALATPEQKEGTTSKTGLFTLIFQRFENNWKIIHDHSS